MSVFGNAQSLVFCIPLNIKAVAAQILGNYAKSVIDVVRRYLIAVNICANIGL